MLESYVSKKRDNSAALRFFKKTLKRHGSPVEVVTDGLRSYPGATNDLGIEDRREMGRWLSNRVESSHLPLRCKERAMLRFRRIKTLQKFAPVHASVHNQFAARPFGSAPTATPPTDKPTRLPAPPPWRSGKRLWPDRPSGVGALRQSETSSR
ncbi:MAG: DDE-type integrase/transposase/recombinase [Chloroflexota bacterium]